MDNGLKSKLNLLAVAYVLLALVTQAQAESVFDRPLHVIIGLLSVPPVFAKQADKTAVGGAA
jgi:hypothetical protein